MALPAPFPRAAKAVCMDLTSPWSSESRFNAPMATRVSLSHAVQKAMAGDRSPSRSSACALPGAVCARALVKMAKQEIDDSRVVQIAGGDLNGGGLNRNDQHESFP
jgi:hypothetical protein